jgi:replicative DNA helicase
MTTELIILSHLIFNEKFARKVLPFIKPEYFESKSNKVVYDLLTEYVDRYNAFPTKEALLIDLSNKTGINEHLFNEAKETIVDIKTESETNIDWLIDTTENFCKERALHNALLKCIKIIDDKDNVMAKGSMTQIMQDALAVTFDNSVGHDFIEDADKRFDFYHTTEKKIPFDLTDLNKITGGGLPTKTLNVFMSVTGGGKTRLMCHCAANNLRENLNVLYITLEMAEERIAERIDANLLDIPLNELKTMPKEIYDGKVARLKTKTKGKLIIKEYPTAGAGSNHFRFLLNELKLKKNFIPDIIYIDYINICMSSRLKMGANVNSYGYIKAIAEELRGLGVEFKVPIVTATQINRSGFCLSLETEVSTSEGKKQIKDIIIGDKLKTKDGMNIVKNIFPISRKKMFKIVTNSGKEIICSADHKFPTSIIEKSINTGLTIGDKLFTDIEM